MPTAFVGETRLPKNFKRYARQFSLLELDCEPGSVPGKARLQSCRAIAPDSFIFSLVVPSSIASLESGPEVDKAWKAAQAVAKVLRAGWWVVRTPAEVRPTRRSREQLAALAARLTENGMRMAWEPRGVWDEVAAGDFATSIGATLVTDVAREAPRPGPVLYSRLLALGRGARVGLGLADTVVERMRAFEQAYVLVEGQGANEIQQALAASQGLEALADDEDLDLDGDDSDDVEDSEDADDSEGADDVDEDEAVYSSDEDDDDLEEDDDLADDEDEAT